MLSPIQKEIVELPGNLIVRASAGTGKTHTMVSKIEYDIAHCHTHKAVAAISEITTDAAWLYNAIAKYFILPKY